ncbi:hypothetical protein DRN73_08125 [Candidatus Pacearchaeota archaeon]|nr:MAG: hypothetical protein DRN73_08125 [Candidatus Pacearchaeota archaeon]
MIYIEPLGQIEGLVYTLKYKNEARWRLNLDDFKKYLSKCLSPDFDLLSVDQKGFFHVHVYITVSPKKYFSSKDVVLKINRCINKYKESNWLREITTDLRFVDIYKGTLPVAKEKERKESLVYRIYKDLLVILPLTIIGGIAVVYLIKTGEKHLIEKLGE